MGHCAFVYVCLHSKLLWVQYTSCPPGDERSVVTKPRAFAGMAGFCSSREGNQDYKVYTSHAINGR